ncbi:endolytic transglycosylase MltG [Anaerocolumna aminovalerica]|jgi:hypothetical protein|uniref:endolytic transglycosylase MltG n=1 Tax=Anaerocolumna aminovalerica TaxID=1527 RepID=UPI001C0EB1C8|nr:endolytic transglycosylase MltG [Anaerocolumna aminovalerica]MBU5333364.1 endolytic transglycosylase MltG [Anaerocolumna aminovalerica]
MKLKYYLRGLGVGILFSTIILSIAFKASSKEKADKVNSNTESNTSGTEAANGDDGIKDLEDLLVPSAAPSITPTVTPTENDISDKETTDTSSEAPSVSPTETPLEEETEESNPVEADQTDDLKEQNEESKDYIIVRIEEGMTSEEVASILYNYGIIEDKNDFNTYMKKNNYSRIINIGDFKIAKNATYEQITDLIVEK